MTAVLPWNTVPARQALWTASQSAAAGLIAVTGLWARAPETAMVLALAVGVSLVRPARAWAFPLVAGGALIGGQVTAAVGLSPLVGAGFTAGLALVWLLGEHKGLADYLQGGFGTSAGSALGLWLAHSVVPDLAGSLWGAVLAASVTAVVASQVLWPLSARRDVLSVPRARHVRRALEKFYQPPVFRALELYSTATLRAPDHEAQHGLAEVTTWVFRLQHTLQTLDRELRTINPSAIRERIASCHTEEADAFTRERRLATAAHLERLLAHRDAMALEIVRTTALVEYSLAFLEEARASLTVAQHLPGDTIPDRLPEVLDRLRTHAAAGDARRRTARELAPLRA